MCETAVMCSGLCCGVCTCLFPFLSISIFNCSEKLNHLIVIKVISGQNVSVQNVSWTTTALTFGDQVINVNTAPVSTHARETDATAPPD